MSQPVADTLKERFSDWIDKRTAKGIAKYGEPLSTFNDRSALLDMTEEILDFAQYQQQLIMELTAAMDSSICTCIHCIGNPVMRQLLWPEGLD